MLKKFLRDTGGNVAPIFAAAVIPIIGLTGAGIDYSRSSAVRADLQSVLDATALMLSKEAATLTEAQLKTKADAYAKAMFKHPEVKNLVVTPVFVKSGSNYTVTVTGSGSIDTMFMRVLNTAGTDFSKMDVATKSEVKWGMKKLELALALDNTGSMDSNNKMTELKAAARSLVDTLYNAAQQTGDIKIAIIPFATSVNVGTANKNASYMEWPSNSEWNEYNGSCNRPYVGAWPDRSKTECQKSTQYYGYTIPPGTWTTVSKNDWNGCVWDRAQPYDTDDTAPTSSATKFQHHYESDCPTKLLPLTDVRTAGNWSAADKQAGSGVSVLGAKINEMQPRGNTNVTIGLEWGWHALTKDNQPLTEAAAVAADLDKVIILLTDGTNTENRFSTDADDIDARTKKACDNVRNANIKVYTVRVIDGNAALLQSCATITSMYYDVQNASQLNAVFQQIAANLASLRISK